MNTTPAPGATANSSPSTPKPTNSSAATTTAATTAKPLAIELRSAFSTTTATTVEPPVTELRHTVRRPAALNLLRIESPQRQLTTHFGVLTSQRRIYVL